MQRFPQNIRLFVATERTTNTIQCCVLYITRHVVHVQYIAASDAGCALGALDWLFAQLLSQAAMLFPHVRYFDFGTCNEQDGRYLNEGLIFQKKALVLALFVTIRMVWDCKKGPVTNRVGIYLDYTTS